MKLLLRTMRYFLFCKEANKPNTQKNSRGKKCSFTLSQLSQSLWTSAKCSPHSLWNEKLSSFYFDELAMNEWKWEKKERRTKLNCGGGRPTRAEKSFKFRFPLLMINRLRTPNNSRKPPSNFRNTSSSSAATQIKNEVNTESFFGALMSRKIAFSLLYWFLFHNEKYVFYWAKTLPPLRSNSSARRISEFS